jgi:hypothetical protein
MSRLIYGHLYVAISPELLTAPDTYERARQAAHNEAMRTGGELLIGPPLLIKFHPLARMAPHLAWPMVHVQPAGEQP